LQHARGRLAAPLLLEQRPDLRARERDGRQVVAEGLDAERGAVRDVPGGEVRAHAADVHERRDRVAGGRVVGGRELRVGDQVAGHTLAVGVNRPRRRCGQEADHPVGHRLGQCPVLLDQRLQVAGLRHGPRDDLVVDRDPGDVLGPVAQRQVDVGDHPAEGRRRSCGGEG
jgi:hypothetical protein